MGKTQNKTRQLQLRLLVDVSERASASLAVTGKEKQCASATRKVVSMALPASEDDMSVYRQISGNYFRSLRKV